MMQTPVVALVGYFQNALVGFHTPLLHDWSLCRASNVGAYVFNDLGRHEEQHFALHLIKLLVTKESPKYRNLRQPRQLPQNIAIDVILQEATNHDCLPVVDLEGRVS